MTALRIDPEDQVAACALANKYTQLHWHCHGQTDRIIELWSRLGAVRKSAIGILEPGLAHECKQKHTDKISEWKRHRTREAKTRLRSARLLVAMPEQASKTVTPLLELCRHEDPEVRVEAAEILGQLPSPPEAVIARLHELLSDDEVHDAVGKSHEDGLTRLYVGQPVARALAGIGVRALPALRQALDSDSFHVRCRAAEGLALLGPDARPATADLIECLKDPTPGIRVAAAKAIAEIAVDDEDVSEALIRSLKDQRLDVRIAAATALSRSPPRATTIRALSDALSDDYLGARVAAAESLGKFGPKATAAAPSLKKVLRDEYLAGRSAAAEALKKVEVDSPASTRR
jgi:HEAT repeat protein